MEPDDVSQPLELVTDFGGAEVVGPRRLGSESDELSGTSLVSPSSGDPAAESPAPVSAREVGPRRERSSGGAATRGV
jgi:hypothetical protein